ncbi:MAG: DNA methyltransferase [Cyanobacteriota bacterium ELA615]
MVYDLELYLHKEWLGLLQPIGLVVSPPALVKSQAFIDSVRAIELQQRLQALVSIEDDVHCLKDFAILAEQILDWLPEDLVKEIPTDLEVVLPDYGETLKPTYAVRDSDSERWIILIQEITTGLLLDEVATENAQGWKASYQDKFERLLRETQIPVGILFNGVELRLVYAPRGESSGYIVFPIRAMTEVSGRLIVGALDMLVGADRLFNVPTNRRLPKILSDSRDYQAEVSTKLASQVLDALWELLRGFQAADDLINGGLLQKLAKDDPQHIYGGLITTLMRLVFLLYAEDEGLMPDDTVYQQNYAVSGLYERLREDAGNYPDTMEQRYGAWTWLLSLFRLVYNGGGNTPNYLPARHGQLFDPDEYPFLEGRSRDSHFHRDKQKDAPRISDDTVYHILENLLILDGEKLSYRALDVEQIGSVYEEIMGFEVKVAQGSSIAIRPKDVVVNIEAILAHKPTDRAKQLENEAECKLSSKEASAVKDAKTAEDLLASLNNKVSSRTPNLLPIGSLFLQPGQERRSTGSHYTPRKLTQPIVETTLRPVLEGLGEFPTAEQLLNLKVCDLAMGSGAFLVEACRQLSEKVLEAWTRENSNLLTADVEPLLAARRLVAQRCLYGVDKNPFAVNLAKLSLWLVTLAKDRPFTFVDHALKCGDSLVGMTHKEIESFGRDTIYDSPLLSPLKKHLENAKSYREEIQAGDTKNNQDDNSKHEKLDRADAELTGVRIVGNVAVAAFFDASTKKEREEKTKDYESQVRAWRNDELYDKESQSERLSILEAIAKDFSQKDRPLKPFNWEIEFPEVFDRENPGFDAIVGNPPFAGKNTTINGNPEGYLDWLKIVHPESHGNSDLVAHFFRRAFNIIRQKGTLGLIATNTIAQGDTRSSGLRFICNNKGTIYNAQKRLKWPGLAAVVVSVVNIFKGQYEGVKFLDGKETQKISAFLFHAGGNDDPKPLLANESKSFIGSYVLGMGFTFDDTNSDATSIEQMQRLIEKDPKNQECIFPYIGGEEVNTSPTHSHHRYVINFGEMSEDEARNYPDLMTIVEEKVKPEREKLGGNPDALRRKNKWWLWGRYTPALFKAIAPLEMVLVTAQVTKHLGFTFLPNTMIFSQKLIIFPLNKYYSFAVLQSRIHEIWTWFFASTLEDRLNYSPSDCFVTFPFPLSLNPSPTGGRGTLNDLLEEVGREYYEFRAQLMVSTGLGLTQTYNRFHNPGDNSPEIVKLRQLHQQMDEAVLEAYGWSDIKPECGFVLEYCDLDTEELPEQIRGRVESGDLFFKSSKEAQEFVYWIDIGKRKGLPWRYRWPEAIHDEVLARLLDLNQKRAEEEILSGLKAQQQEKTTKKPKAKKTTKGDEGQMGLFSSQE